MTKEFKIIDTLEVCPYCYEPKGDKTSCCGENHFELAYDIGDEYILASEVSIEKEKQDGQ